MRDVRVGPRTVTDPALVALVRTSDFAVAYLVRRSDAPDADHRTQEKGRNDQAAQQVLHEVALSDAVMNEHARRASASRSASLQVGRIAHARDRNSSAFFVTEDGNGSRAEMPVDCL